MDLTHAGEYNLTGLSKINIILGKNGSGKSSLLKKVEQHLSGQNNGEINYVTPERGGSLSYLAHVDQNAANDPNWSKNNKRQNQWGEFKSHSVAQYRRLEILHLREIEKDRSLPSFDTIIDKINNLLTNVKIVRTNKGDFELFTKVSNTKIQSNQISSGESELIALTIECLTYEKTCEAKKQNLLLLDEPDVHLHPDLQANFILFLSELLKSNKFSVIIATHSTAILGSLLNNADSKFAILTNGKFSAEFKPLNEMHQSILPIFGAHPLSNLFNLNPILLVEGDDDVRIWQQAIRTSNGALKFYPCSVGGNGNLNDYENSVIEIINGVYDNAKAFSIRDRDDGDENTVDTPPLVRFKLSCRAAENLILCDEVLTSLNTSWKNLQVEIEKWLATFTTHAKFAQMFAFKNEGYNRKAFDLKEIRNIIIGLTETSKPWEVSVGQVIGQFVNTAIAKDTADNKLCNFLGAKLTNKLRSS